MSRLLSQLDVAELNVAQQQNLADIKHGLIDTRLDIQDYELAETRDEQLRNAKQAKERLASLRVAITSNTLNVFGSVDVAHLSAQLEHIADQLR